METLRTIFSREFFVVLVEYALDKYEWNNISVREVAGEPDILSEI